MQITVNDFKVMYDSLYINHYFLNVLIDAYIKECDDGIADKDREEALARHKTLPECEQKYNICMHVVEINKRFRGINQTETFRVAKSLDALIVDDYFTECRVDPAET
jgi:hypothetical protein